MRDVARPSFVASVLLAASVLAGCQTTTETFIDDRMADGQPANNVRFLG
jgi:hypothetical protein